MDILRSIRRFLADDHDRLEGLLRAADHGALALLLVPTPTADLVAEVRSILDAHNEIEEGEDGVYAACDRLLGDEQHAVLERLKIYPPVKVAPHFDGPGIVRSAEDALRAVSRPNTSKNETSDPD